VNASAQSRRRVRIAARVALLSWAVTIATLTAFVAFEIPAQRRTFIENLHSKARGISVSLQDITAGAILEEDFSAVIDHCRNVLEGDPTIEFLVATKDEGFSLLNLARAPTSETDDAEGTRGYRWSMEQLDESWRPVRREAFGRIEDIPIVGTRVYRFARPFDYAGVQWGWIHVGLSLDGYHAAMTSVYRRTLLLAIVCLLASLAASIAYARRIVRPLHRVARVVSRVAAGDLDARADIRTGDEIQDLAWSINRMTLTLQHRDRILQGVRFAAEQFLRGGCSDEVIRTVLDHLLHAADFSRVYVFTNEILPDGDLGMSYTHEVVAPGVSEQIGEPSLRHFSYRANGFGDWADILARGEPIYGLVEPMPSPVREVLQAQGIQSICIMPVFVESAWWGFIGFDQCDHPRVWSRAEIDSLRAAAEMLGAAVERARVQDALLEAKNTLEERVRLRTHELEEQVAAKETALASLADAQQRLLTTSRLAGMAEVANGVLHNVGNVLNSVNLSVHDLSERIGSSRIAHLRQAVGLIQAQNGSLASFLTDDPRGRALPGFLAKLADHFEDERVGLAREANRLVSSIEHIKEIVSTQQSYARVLGAIEALSPVELVDDAVRLNASAVKRHSLRIERRYEPTPHVLADRHKVAQILVNLVSNAKDAVAERPIEQRLVTLCIRRHGTRHVALAVTDNGIGIAPENLARIFQHGFTTKTHGHGFGLHASALGAHEMGGRLTVESPGVDRGATFTLLLPAADA
jgi:signal transduction histidine kinase